MPVSAPGRCRHPSAEISSISQARQGADLFIHAETRAAYWPLAAQFVTQENPAFCGVASLVMVMNALRIPPPAAKETSVYLAFTQSNFLSDATEKILPRAVLLKQGITLDQIGLLAETYPVLAEVHHASGTRLDEFRAWRSPISSKGTTWSWSITLGPWRGPRRAYFTARSL